MGSKRNHNQGYTQVKVLIPTPLAKLFNTLTSDPLTGKAKYGLKSKVITRLLHNWAAEQARSDEPRGEFLND